MGHQPPLTYGSVDRVVVRHRQPPLPLPVAAQLAGRVRWLREQLPSLDRDLGVTYPRIDVIPAAWHSRLKDSWGPVSGRVHHDPSSGMFVVQLSAPALLEYPDDLVIGVLVHEFLHVVHHTIATWRHFERAGAGTVVPPFYPSDYGTAASSLASYRRQDAALQADPDVWLSERLRQLQVLAESGGPQITTAAAAIIDHWVKAGLPLEDGVESFTTARVAIDEALIARARALGVLD